MYPMYNLIKYSLNYSETTRSSWFYSKDEATNFNNNIDNDDNFNPCKHKAKLLGKTEADNVNGILKSTTISVLLKYLSNFWRSIEMSLINCKVEFKT